ncbi:MAG: hypothetical protein A2W90_21275 [Bacteroidetes bacterium GWF2_42_66]|nr:MAG: hypothetical protein A2W92_02395 [Bacteroidetes bacterium GWA2_42_15]OFX98867.1 MAG: hypothetical protein A2W89_12915 [Bacteroidetes bacterium GWE2_42_39]OFY45581.1 MAG: hypothetical protein A2W90_21275 [Bacteroidetes bacterium GWF2_42_66]HBL77439.1 hypothetical protein [Prolixibacteraceae bacterium]HCR90987.1 hypothetical protein [Prolixibacteraceae bacterium]
MRSIILLIIVFNIAFSCYSQEENEDSLIMSDFELKEKKLFYDQLFIFSDNSLYGDLIRFDAAFFNQPLFPETNWKIDFNALKNLFTANTPNNYSMFYGYNPFFSSFSIMNQARYQINDRLSIGGNSFSGSSIFDPMPMNRPFNERDIKGASMFLEYKVSKKFKIGTRIDVMNQKSMFPAP